MVNLEQFFLLLHHGRIQQVLGIERHLFSLALWVHPLEAEGASYYHSRAGSSCWFLGFYLAWFLQDHEIFSWVEDIRLEISSGRIPKVKNFPDIEPEYYLQLSYI